MSKARPTLLTLLLILVVSSCGGSQNHSHSGFEIPDSEPVPTIELNPSEDSVAGWNLQLIVTNFAFAPERAGNEFVLGEGHGHLYIDGLKRDRLYGPWYHLDGLSPGSHTIEVTLNANDHAVYLNDGEAISAEITIENAPTNHAHTGDLPLEADPGMTVDLSVEQDSLTGWNLFVDTTGFIWAPGHAGSGHLAGEGHAHLYVDGRKIGRIYGPAAYLGSVPPGEHTITISLHGNNHAPYAINGEPVEDSVSLEVVGESIQVDHLVSIEISDGGVEGGVRRVSATRGETVEIVVTSDSRDVVHVHGYDLTAAVEANTASTVRFTAEIRGVFEVELEESGLLIVELTVR